MIKFFKKYWFIIVLGFIATILVIVNLFIPKQKQTVSEPTQPSSAETFKGITPGKTSVEDLSKVLGAPDPKLSDFSKNMLVYTREGGGPGHEAVVNGNTVEFFKQQALQGNVSDYVEKYGKFEGEYYGEYQESGFKTYVWPNKGLAAVASINNGYLFEVWYFKPTTLDDFLKTWGKDLTNEPKKTEGY